MEKVIDLQASFQVKVLKINNYFAIIIMVKSNKQKIIMHAHSFYIFAKLLLI